MNTKKVESNRFLEEITRIFKLNKLSHAYLVDVGNSSSYDEYIKKFIKMILCNQKKELDGLNCSKCNVCSLIDSDNYPDVKVIDSNGTLIKKGQLLDLKSDFQNKSLLNNKKIYVIKYAEDLNPSSANSILKFLEEPEDDIIAILITRNYYKVMRTIISRCQLLSFYEKNTDNNIKDEVFSFMNYIINPYNLFIEYKAISDTYFKEKESIRILLNEIEFLLVDFLNYYFDNDYDFNNDLKKMLLTVDYNYIVKCISIIEDCLLKLRFNVNIKIWQDDFFANLVEVF